MPGTSEGSPLMHTKRVSCTQSGEPIGYLRERIDVIDEGAVERKVSAVVRSNRCRGLQSGVMYADPFRQIRIQERHLKALAYLRD